MHDLISSTHPHDPHRLEHSGWLRASVLGANDGLVSIGSLSLGMVAAGADPKLVLLTGSAGLVAGAMSMAVGEYVSVASQADIEDAEHARERRALAADPHGEFDELAAIYERRGLSPETARQVAKELTDEDELAAHLRDEIGLIETHAANPMRAAATSGASFFLAGSMPIAIILLAPPPLFAIGILTITLVTLILLGLMAAHTGGAPYGKSVMRAVICGSLALAITSGAGALFGNAMH